MRPTRKAVYLVLWVLGISFAAPFGPVIYWIWVGAVGLVVVGLLLDFALVLRRPLPSLKRRLSQSLPLGVWTTVRLFVHNPGKKSVPIRCHDHHPTPTEIQNLPFNLTIPAEMEAEIPYRIRFLERGIQCFGAADLLMGSPLGLWWRVHRPGTTTRVRVFPNFQAVSRYTLLATSLRLTQLGIHKRRRRGEGREFHQLREYVQGDPMRNIDWKASSRMRKLISRDFQDARDQQVIFLLDCGRTMRAKDGELSHFDHALNAVLLMTHVALIHGDAVGLMTFSGEKRTLSPRKGPAQMSLILNAVFDIKPGMQTSDFLSVTRECQTHLRKRSLIILVTNLRDEDDEELYTALGILRRAHLVLLTSVRERILEDTINGPIVGFSDALRVAATHAYLKGRRESQRKLSARGIYSLDTLPEQLPIAMINGYLDIKSSGLL